MISISPGNRKTGFIPSFSLPAVSSCLNSKTCETFMVNGKKRTCYAASTQKRYKNVKIAWDRNMAESSDLESLYGQLKAWFVLYKPSLFRIHVSGDFISKEYLGVWIRIAKAFPKTKFLAFTKVYGFFYGVKLPDNMSVVFSFMPQIPYEQAVNFAKKAGDYPIAYVSDEKIKGAITCPNQVNKEILCSACKICWKINKTKRQVKVHFYPH